MPFWTAVKTCFKKYFVFKGRARRSEYWWFVLFVAVLSFIWTSLSAFFTGIGIEAYIRSAGDLVSFDYVLLGMCAIIMLPLLVIAIPVYSALTRRLHDTGRSGWWVVACLVVSLIYTVVCFYWIFNEFESPAPVVILCLGLLNMAMGIALLVFSVQDSQWGDNKYGPSPKEE